MTILFHVLDNVQELARQRCEWSKVGIIQFNLLSQFIVDILNVPSACFKILFSSLFYFSFVCYAELIRRMNTYR